MSGTHKVLATLMKPLAIYFHCYAHRLNLALQDALSPLECLKNDLGTIKSLHNDTGTSGNKL